MTAPGTEQATVRLVAAARAATGAMASAEGWMCAGTADQELEYARRLSAARVLLLDALYALELEELEARWGKVAQ